MPEQRLGEPARARVRAALVAKRPCPGEGARVESDRQLEAILQLAGAARSAEDEARAGDRLHAQPLEDGPLGQPLQVVARDDPKPSTGAMSVVASSSGSDARRSGSSVTS